MSLMINGQIREDWLEAETEQGEFIRKDSVFRNWVTADGSAGSTGTAGFKAEPERYHLYISHACPWAHRTLIFRTLKKLEHLISVSIVHPHMGDKGWEFADFPGSSIDHCNHKDFMYEVYQVADANYTGIVTVPVLWDKQTRTIVNNESSEIIRMFNSAFNAYTTDRTDYYPAAQKNQIDEINTLVYENINNGVYRCGFAQSQQAYETAYDRLFIALDQVEDILDSQAYLIGNNITEADWRLFTTLLRFDAVYFGHFKCNKKRIIDYPNLHNYLLELFQYPGIAETVNMQHIKQHYYYSHTSINPTRIVPKGPDMDFMQPHNRNRFR